MNIEQDIEKMKEAQSIILEFIDDDDCPEKKYENFTKFLNDNKELLQEYNKTKAILYLIKKIANNHHRNPDFNNKIQRILDLFKAQINQIFSNDDIFTFFKGNKRILLFLIEERILQVDESIASQMNDSKYYKYKFKEYFLPELKSFPQLLTQKQIEEEIPSDFEKKRQIGENDKYLCELIQKDMVEDFITYYNKTNFKLNSKIDESPFETNKFLLQNQPTLIEYSAFCGSLQIFNFLNRNNVKLSQSLWLYAIHGSNPEMIHFLEDNKVQPFYNSFEICLKESIKCHHNNIASYIDENILSEKDRYTINNRFYGNIYSYSYNHHNYYFFPNEISDEFNLYYACKYDYFDIVEYFLNETQININEAMISKLYFIYNI